MFLSVIGRIAEAVSLFLSGYSFTPTQTSIAENIAGCRTVQHGYNCQPELSHNWGHYSPWFSAPSEIPPSIPAQCNVTFAQVLSRHGSRDPTNHKTLAYQKVIHKIHRTVKEYSAEYSFIRDYQYSLGADELTVFGQQELFDSGIHFYERYRSLSAHAVPFVRASGRERVVQSAQNWTQGFEFARVRDDGHEPAGSHAILVIPEGKDSNNTLSHGLCDALENTPYNTTSSFAKAQWRAVFVPPIRDRVHINLLGADLTDEEVIYLMDLCPFNVVASPSGVFSPFCNLFTHLEWEQYNYYQSLDKFYGYGSGNLLAPVIGLGFTNELIARLTNAPVIDDTSTNHTLDANPATFPLGQKLYADFSHDNTMTSIMFAMGLFNSSMLLSTTFMETLTETDGYSSAHTVPFAGRIYFEKLTCSDAPVEDMVRVLVNDRVLPLRMCNGDFLGRCTLNNFVKSVKLSTSRLHWSQCFVHRQQ